MDSIISLFFSDLRLVGVVARGQQNQQLGLGLLAGLWMLLALPRNSSNCILEILFPIRQRP